MGTWNMSTLLSCFLEDFHLRIMSPNRNKEAITIHVYNHAGHFDNGQ